MASSEDKYDIYSDPIESAPRDVSIPALTAAGRAYAESTADVSLVARVALADGEGWPLAHYATAVRVCNACGREDGNA